ncbi:MAG: DUF1116 domain-containing protein [Planctomycetota bacterium]|jgi:hypothetical protein|nr:DUF1116 domain-containing protein [Planctomycetota bacterium]
MPGGLRAVNIGVGDFLSSLREDRAPFADVDWKPPARGDSELIDILFNLEIGFRDMNGDSLIDIANHTGLRRILAARPVVRRVLPARELIPDFGENVILHAGPPIEWENMCGPMRGAIIGAALYEKLAPNEIEAARLLRSGSIVCQANFGRKVVAPMAGAVSRSMPLFLVENETAGNVAHSPLNEGLGHTLRFGANHPPVLARLKWLENVLAPALDRALVGLGGVALKPIMSQALLMGDEMHQRNVAASQAFYRSVAMELVDAAEGSDRLKSIVSFLARENEQFFLNLAMAAAKVAMDAARDIPHSTLITAMNRNGVDFGVHLSATGDRWFTAPSLYPKGFYFPGYGEADANPDMGDSAIVECYGVGGMALGAVPSAAHLVGAGNLMDSLEYAFDMSHICSGRNPDLAIPCCDFAGAPAGIDVRKVVATGILPLIISGVAHHKPGVGQIGTGLVTPPMEVMNKALRAFHQMVAE